MQPRKCSSKMKVRRFVTYSLFCVLSFCIRLTQNRKNVIFPEEYGPTGHTNKNVGIFDRELNPGKITTYH